MYSNIFDSHAHYDSRKFQRDVDYLLKEYLPDNGVVGIMSAADSLPSAKRAEELANKYDNVFFAAGIHPHNAKDAPADLEDIIKGYARNPKMRAVGEIGLDYYRDLSPRDLQMDICVRQIEVAKELDLPIIFHDRDAHGDTMDVLRKHRPKGIVHSFSGSVEMAMELVEMGFYLGFAGVITYPNARRPIEAVAAIPVERLLLETDAPYLPPEPFRGKRSDSAMIAYTAKKMAEIKGMDAQELINIVRDNTCRVFGISKSQLG